LVNFSADYSQEAGIDDMLRYPAGWKNQALAIGGIINYGANGRNDPGGEPIVLAVLLRGTPKGLMYELRRNPPEGEGDVTILAREDEAGQPYSFFLPDRTVFSQLQMQACLDLAVPADEAAQALLENARAELVAAGVLPADSTILMEGARATLVGSGAGGSVSIEEVAALGPDLILAAGLPFVEETFDLIDVSFGDGVLAVTRDIEDFVASSEGEIVTLNEGAYRLDVVDDDPDLVGQLVATDGTAFYFPLQAGQLEGTPVEDGSQGSESTDVDPEVAVDRVCILRYCKKKKPKNNPTPCVRKPAKWSVSICFW
jgi:hypothetical protein